MKAPKIALFLSILAVSAFAQKKAEDAPQPPTLPISAEDRAEFERLLAIQNAPPSPTISTGDGVTAHDMTFQSKSLEREMRYRILLPAGYAKSHQHYPVLYMLHGFMNPYYEWDRQSELARHLDKYDLIVVLPQGDNSWYLISETVPKDKYMRYLLRDLRQEIETKYRVISETYGRAIAGLSMGGYGAMVATLRFPGLFAFAANFSGAPTALSDPQMLKDMGPWGLDAILGPKGSKTRTDNDVLELVAKAKPEQIPYIWMTCANDDHTLTENLEFAAALRKQKIAFEFHNGPGSHEWDYWNRQLPRMLESLADHLKVNIRKRER
jgi:S-formylglutathione hydrolase FrmB